MAEFFSWPKMFTPSRHRSVCCLVQHAAQIFIAFRGSAAMVLLRAFLLARTEVGRQTPEHGLKITAFLRHADKSPSRWFLFRRIRIHNNHHQHFLAYVSPPPSSLLPPSLEAAERTHNKATHPHVLPSGYCTVARHGLVQNVRS